MYSADNDEMPKSMTMTEVNDDIQARITAKRLAGMIRTLKEEIINEINTLQEINGENCQLEINIHQFKERLKELDILCANCENSNAEIERQKRRYSEQLIKISKLISEQNFDAVNWAIILDEMVFVNRELFEILLSTAIAERRALQMEVIEEEKYRNITEKLILKRIDLRQELHSQMNSYESLRAQINQTESNLTNLQKSIDVYDAEYWQLNDAKHDLQMQVFQLQELLRQRRCYFNSFSKSSLSHTDKDDKDKSASDKSLIMRQKKSNAVILDHKISKKTNNSTANGKSKGQSVSKIVSKVKHDARANIISIESKEAEKNKDEMTITSDASNSSSSSNIRSNFMWRKKTDLTKNQSIPANSSISSNESNFFIESHKLPFDSKLAQKRNLNRSTSMESFMTTTNITTPSQTVANEAEIKKQTKYSGPVKLIEVVALSPNSVKHNKSRKSLIDLKQNEKNGMNKVTVNDEVGKDQEASTDFQSSNGEDSSKFSSSINLDDDRTDLTSDSIPLSDKSSNSLKTTSSINSDIKEGKKSSSLLNSSTEQHAIRQPYYTSESENTSQLSSDDKTDSEIRNKSDREVKFPGIGLEQQQQRQQQQQQQQQQLINQPRYNRLLYYEVESDEQQSESLPLQNRNVELWQEISERTFLRDIANRFN